MITADCTQSKSSDQQTPTIASAVRPAASNQVSFEIPLIEGARATARPAIRCAECHTTMHAEWMDSAHARANRTADYLSMRNKTGNDACDSCHAPLKALTDPGDIAIDEGVTCDVCHTLKRVTLMSSRTTLGFVLAENTMQGTLCETQDHYFHKTSCEPLFQRSELCAGCHRWSFRSPSGALIAVLTEYDEWLKSPSGSAGVTCQNCHMPEASTEVANGWKRVANIGNHSCMGEDEQLRLRALGMKLSVDDHDGNLEALVTVKNDVHGHSIPTGFPGKQVLLRMLLLDPEGREVERRERFYARVLVNAAGEEVPFYEAQSQKADTRLAPAEVREESFTFKTSQAGTLRASLVWRKLSPTIVAALDTQIEEMVLAEAQVPFGAPRPGLGRALLPKQVTIDTRQPTKLNTKPNPGVPPQSP